MAWVVSCARRGTEAWVWWNGVGRVDVVSGEVKVEARVDLWSGMGLGGMSGMVVEF